MNKEIRTEMSEEAKIKMEQVLVAISAELPPIIFRNWHRWRDVLPMVPRSVANDDSRGEGPAEKVYAGRVCGYPKKAFLEYLRKKIHFVGSPSCMNQK